MVLYNTSSSTAFAHAVAIHIGGQNLLFLQLLRPLQLLRRIVPQGPQGLVGAPEDRLVAPMSWSMLSVHVVASPPGTRHWGSVGVHSFEGTKLIATFSAFRGFTKLAAQVPHSA